MLDETETNAVLKLIGYELEQHGALSNRRADEIGEDYGLCRRTVRRYEKVAKGEKSLPRLTPASPFGGADKAAVLSTYFSFDGDIRATYNDLSKRGLFGLSESTFRRRLEDNVELAHLRYPFEGDKALTKYQAFGSRDFLDRLERWEFDYFAPNHKVVGRGGVEYMPKYGICLDSIGLGLAWIRTNGAPTASDAIHCLTAAMLGRTIYVPGYGEVTLGGKPDMFFADNGDGNQARELANFLRMAGIAKGKVAPYAGWQKPYAENLVGRVKRKIREHQARTKGPEHDDGSRIGESSDPIPEEVMDYIVEQAIEETNLELAVWDDKSPLYWWTNSTRPLEYVSDEVLRYGTLCEAKTATVAKNGISFRGELYAGTDQDAYNRNRGKKAQVRYYANNRDAIELFMDGKWWMRAVRKRKQSQEQKDALAQSRKAVRMESRVAEREAELMRRSRTAQANAEATISLGLVSRQVDGDIEPLNDDGTRMGSEQADRPGSPAPVAESTATDEQSRAQHVGSAQPEPADDYWARLQRITQYQNGQVAPHPIPAEVFGEEPQADTDPDAEEEALATVGAADASPSRPQVDEEWLANFLGLPPDSVSGERTEGVDDAGEERS